MAAARRTRMNVLAVLRVVQDFADDWKPERQRNKGRGPAWEATAADGDVLKELVLGITSVLEGLRPFSDLRRMHALFAETDRDARERRARVVVAVHHTLWVWARTEKHPVRRKEAVSELIQSLAEEHPSFAKLSEREVVAVFKARTGREGAEHVAGVLSAKCRAFGDSNAVRAADAYRQAFKARRRRK